MSIGVMLFNPFTGKPRHPSDIESDPHGILIWDGEEPLKTQKPKREWVGLTDEEELMIGVATGMDGIAIRMIEAKLKEKNT